MINKQVADLAQAVAGIQDGSTVLVGGFGSVGQPVALIDALIEQGARELTVVANNAGGGTEGLARLFIERRVRKLICSFPRSKDPSPFELQYRAKEVELEIVPQGTLAERLRAAGAGVGAFYTPTGYGTRLGEGKPTMEINGRLHVLEYALQGDVALIEAWNADRWGNLTYQKSGRNFNPVMAMAAKRTIVQAQHMVGLGELDAESVVTPGIFVTQVVHVPYEGSL